MVIFNGRFWSRYEFCRIIALQPPTFFNYKINQTQKYQITLINTDNNIKAIPIRLYIICFKVSWLKTRFKISYNYFINWLNISVAVVLIKRHLPHLSVCELNKYTIISWYIILSRYYSGIYITLNITVVLYVYIFPKLQPRPLQCWLCRENAFKRTFKSWPTALVAVGSTRSKRNRYLDFNFSTTYRNSSLNGH